METSSNFLLAVKDECLAIKELLLEHKLLFVAIGLALACIAYYFNPFPGRKIVIATSDSNSGYTLIAKDQEAYLKQRGVNLLIQNTAGSINSAELLSDPKSDVSAAFIQGGVLSSEQAKKIESLGSVAYEPVWIFYNKKLQGRINEFKDLSKWRVGIGPKNSGTSIIAKKLFSLNGIYFEKNDNFREDSYENNFAQFLNGELDVIFNVNPGIDPIVQKLLYEPKAVIFEFKHAIAYDRNLSFIKVVTLPAFSINIERRIPPSNISLIATTASLAVRKDLHPSLQTLLLMATKDVQRNSQNVFLSSTEQFPAYIDPTIPISAAALRYYDYGVPQTMRYFPFWLAGFVDQMWVFILTILAIGYPLSHLNINLRKIRFEQKIDRYYRILMNYEHTLCVGASLDEKVIITEKLKLLMQRAMAGRIPAGCEKDYFEFMNFLEDLLAKAR